VKLGDIASLVNGEVTGPPEADDLDITGVSDIRTAREGDITFISSERYRKYLQGCKASCILVGEPIEGLKMAQLRVPNPRLAFAKLLGHFYIEPKKPLGISEHAIVSDKAIIGKDVSIFPFSYISDNVSVGDRTIIYPHVFIGRDAVIGEDCVFYSNVTLREKVKIGSRVIVHSGTVIGSDGFGYVSDKGKYRKIPQVGGVIIEDDVEIGSNVSVDRATTGNTTIGAGTKIDNLVQIAHNVTVGRNSLIIAQVGIAGSSEIGDYVTLAGQAGIVDHVRIESGTVIGAQSGVTGNLEKGIYSGSPVMPHREWLKAQVVFGRLPELYKKIKELEEKIKELERRDYPA
jgi:UDP-3-O-[3-hydroxymyristoyl] glucosamine N-acyltransferase